jgi:hypothetical protein
MGIFKKIKETLYARSFSMRPDVSSAEMTDFVASKYPQLEVINRGNDVKFRVQVKVNVFTNLDILKTKANKIAMTMENRLWYDIVTLAMASDSSSKGNKIINELYPAIKEKFGV